MAAIGIYRLLFVEELCEIREVQEFMTDMRRSAEKRPRKMRLIEEPIGDTIVVARDPSLEETHEKNLKSEAPPTTTVTKHTEPQSLHSSAQTVTTETNKVQETTTSEKLGLEKSTKKLQLSTTDSVMSTANEFSNTADGSVKKIVKKVLNNDNSPFLITANSSKEFDSDEGNTTASLTVMVTETSTKAAAVNDKAISSRMNDYVNEDLLQTANDKVPEEAFRKSGAKVKLVNRVHNCLPTGIGDILGIGVVDLPYAAAICVPIICLIVSIMIASLSTMNAYMNFYRPHRCRIFAENVTQVFLWVVSAITLLLTRQDWDLTWDGAMSGAFVPEYPSSWQCAEVCCGSVLKQIPLRQLPE
uniref:Aa_trans domain-containing protein n=1 Tax=Angiostrongylus cantonensis TaxID=6313 RepID=A0A0K0CX57_ANGCA